MQHRRRLLTFLAVTLISTTLLTACGGGTSTNEAAGSEKQTLRILSGVAGGKTPEEHEMFEKEVERLTGMNVDIEKPSADYDKKLLTAMSNGEKYDLVYLNQQIMDQLVDQGVLTDLTDKVEQSSILGDPEVIPTEDWEMLKYDGKIYSVFNKFEGGTLPIVRQDWMDKLGLKEPKTLDEMYNVLKAFKEQDPDGNKKDDTFGLSVAGLYDIQGFMSAAGLKYKYVIDENGKRTIPYATDAAVPMYEWFAKLYKEGILDPSFATNDTKKMRDLFLTDRVGMVTYWDVWVGQFNNLMQKDNPKFEAKGISGIPGPDGKVLLRRGEPSVWGIPVNAEHPDLAMKFLEFWHTEPGNILGTLGIEGHDYKMENGKYELTDIGKEHSSDHGAPIPNNVKFKNPFGELAGVEEARNIVLDSGATVEVGTARWSEAEKIVQNYAFQAMMGKMPAAEAVAKMDQELRAAKLID